MDVDDVHTTRPQASHSKTLPIDENHPFDFDQYISLYSGRGLVERLLFLIPQCPSLAVQASQLVLKHLRSMRDTSLYQRLWSAYDQAATNASQDAPLPPANDVINIDPTWIDDVNRRNQEDRTKLEVELKTYTSNMIKESIRVRSPACSRGDTAQYSSVQMAHRDLAEYYRAVGDPQSALKHYAKLREFCTTSQHVLDMCLAVLEVRIPNSDLDATSIQIHPIIAAH